MPNVLLRPALGILDPLRLSRKFGLIALLFLLAAVVPALLRVRLQNARLAVALRQEEGVRFFRPLASLGEHLSLHHLAPPAGTPGEGPDARRRLEGLQEEDLDHLDRIGREVGGHLGLGAAVAGLRQRIAALPGAGDPVQQAAAHEHGLREIRELESRVVDASRLMAGDEPTAFHVMEISTRTLPELAAQLVHLTLLAREGLADQVADSGEKAAFQRQNGAIQGPLASLQEGMAAARPEVARRLKDPLEALGKATLDLLALVDARFQGGGPPAAIDFTGAEAVRSCFAFQGLALRVLEDGLQERIRGLRQDQAWALAGSTLAALLAFYLLAGLYAGLGREFRALGESLEALARGELAHRDGVESRDGLGALAGPLNRAQEGLGDLVAGLQASHAALRDSARRITRECAALVQGLQGEGAGLDYAGGRVGDLRASAEEADGELRRAEAGAGRLHVLVTEGREAVAQAAWILGELAAETGRMEEAVRGVEDLAFRARLAALDGASGEGGEEAALLVQVHELGRRGAQASRRVLGRLQGAGARLQAGASAAARAQGVLEGIRMELGGLDAALTNLRGATRGQGQDLEELRRVAGELEGLIRGNAARAGAILAEAGNPVPCGLPEDGKG